MYVDPNYKTKKDFKVAIAAGVQYKPYNPSGMFSPPINGTTTIEMQLHLLHLLHP